MSLTGRSRCTKCLAEVSTARFLAMGHLCIACYIAEDDEDYPLQSTPLVGDVSRSPLAPELPEILRNTSIISDGASIERLEANGWRVGSADEFLERTEETSPSDIDPVAI
jgi:hypothetical protein